MNDFSHILNIETAVTGFSEFSRADNLFRDTGLSIINPDMTSTTEISCEDVGEPHTVLSCACGEPATIEGKCVNCANGKSVKKTGADASFSWSNGWDADREWNHQFPPQGKTSKNSILKMSQGTYVPDEKAKWGENWNNFTMIISKDSGTEAGTKSYRASQQCHEEFINFMLSRTLTERYYYEIIPALRPVKLYYDLETDPNKGPRKTELEWDGIKTNLITRTIHALERYFPEECRKVGGINHEDFLVLNASGKDAKKNDAEKSSYHIILAKKIAFSNIEHLNMFLKESKLLNPIACSMVDDKVYKTHTQSFRIACNIKKNDPHERYLVIEECPGFTKEECSAAYREGRQKIKKGKLPRVKKYPNMLKKMILDSMITYVPADMALLEIDKKKMEKKRKEVEKAAKDQINKDPDLHTLPASNDDVLLSMCKSLVTQDKNYVEDYDEWIKIGRLLWSAGARENVWIEFSNMAKNPSSNEELLKQWRYFGKQNLTNDPEMIYNYIKKRCPEAVDDARMLSIDRMDVTPASISQTLAALYGDRVVFDAGCWYYKEGVHWVQDPETSRLGEIIMTDFQRELDQKIRKLKQTNKEIEDQNKGEDEKDGEISQEATLNTSKIDKYKKIKEITGSGRIGHDWFTLKVFFGRRHFSERLDERQTILAFDNGIIDLEGTPIKNSDGTYKYEPILDSEGYQQYSIDNVPLKKLCREIEHFEIREPEEYMDSEGKPRMEFIQKSCGYRYISKRAIFDKNTTSDNVRKAYLRHARAWNAYLRKVFPDKKERSYLMYMLATTLNGDINFQHFYVWTGTNKFQNGSNSKSILKRIVELVMGDYANTCTPQILTQAEPAANQANSAMMNLKGLRLAFFDEPETANGLKTNVIKRLTGGDKISTRELRSTQVTFRCNAKMVCLCNEIPEPDKRDDGWWRRMKIFPFMAKFVDDPEDSKWESIEYVEKRDNNLEKNIEQWKLPILHSLLECYVIFNTAKGKKVLIEHEPGIVKEYAGLGRSFPKCELMEDTLQEFKNDGNIIKEWLEDNIVSDPQGVLYWKHLKHAKNETIKAIYKNQKAEKLIRDIESPDGGGLGPLWGHKSSPKKFRFTAYVSPDGEKHMECWGGWRIKTEEEREMDQYKADSEGSRGIGNSTSGVFECAFDE